MFIFILTSFASADYCLANADAEITDGVWDNPLYADDENTATGSHCSYDGDWCIIEPNVEAPDSTYKLVGIGIYGESARGNDLYLDINVNIDSEATDVNFYKNTWTYYNFSQQYAYNSYVNLSWNKHVAGKGVIYEVRLLFDRSEKGYVVNLFPTPTSTCVDIKTNISWDTRLILNSGCSQWANTTIYTNESYGYYKVVDYHNETITTSGVTYYYKFNEFERFGKKYYYAINITTKDDYNNELVYHNLSRFVITEACPLGVNNPEESLPKVDGLTDWDCWQMVSIFHPDGYLSKGSSDLKIYNNSDSSYSSFATSVLDGDIYNGIFWYNSTNTSYDNVTIMYNNKGYWVYFYNDSCEVRNQFTYTDTSNSYNDTSIDTLMQYVNSSLSTQIHWDYNDMHTNYLTANVLDYYIIDNVPQILSFNVTNWISYSCIDYVNMNGKLETSARKGDVDFSFTENDDFDQISTDLNCDIDIDESLLDNGNYNFSLSCGNYVNVEWESWFNDTNPDTLETVLTLGDYNCTPGSGSGCDFPIWINWSNGNITINMSIMDCDGTNDTNASVNESSYLFIAGLQLDTDTVIILLIIVLFLLTVTILDAIKSVLCGFACTFICLGTIANTSLLVDLNLYLGLLMFISAGVTMYKFWLGVTEGDIVLPNRNK